jgi:hypothetical protein
MKLNGEFYEVSETLTPRVGVRTYPSTLSISPELERNHLNFCKLLPFFFFFSFVGLLRAQVAVEERESML